jgi:hypothetical protein
MRDAICYQRPFFFLIKKLEAAPVRDARDRVDAAGHSN